jgi:hypothetical protein
LRDSFLLVKFTFRDLFAHGHQVLDKPTKVLMGAQLLAQQGQVAGGLDVTAAGLAPHLGRDEEVGAVEPGRLGLAAAAGFAADIEALVQIPASQGADLGDGGDEATAFLFERLVSGHEAPPCSPRTVAVESGFWGNAGIPQVYIPMDYITHNKPCQGLSEKNFHGVPFPLAILPGTSYLNGIGSGAFCL